MGALLVLLLTFPLQYANEQSNHTKISKFQAIVHNAKEQAKQEGYFTDAILNEMKSEIVNAFNDVQSSEITIDVTQLSDRKERGQLIHYRIGIPVKKIIAVNKFWGIDPNDNQMIYIIDKYTPSEWVRP